MANISQIKLPNGDVYNFQDSVSGYLVPSDIEGKVDNFHIQIGEQISGDYYSIDKTYADIFAVILAGKDYVTCSDVDLGYPYVGIASINNNTVIAFGISATFDNMAYLDGYLILPNDTAMHVHEATIIPTKTSQLTNDSGFITSYTETDPTVPSWAKASSKPTYTASEVGALPSSTIYVSKITTTAGTHTAISNKSGAVSFNVPTTAAHVGIKFGYTTSGNNRAVLQDSSGNLYVTQKDDNTTYSAGTGLSLSSGSFSVKTGYTTSGNNRAVQADSNGNLYVVQTDNNTTYSAGTGLSLSSTTFSVKLGYTTSGNNRAVQADTNGNLYVVQKDDNTTYSSKAAASGGTDVSLVTTGEKYTWNSKTSNTGTITSVKTTAGAHSTINITSGAANFNVPTKTSHLTNDSGFTTTSYVDSAINALPEPMIFKGSVGTGGTVTSLPTAAASNEGWTYKVITALSNPSAKVGDTVISNGSSWIVIPSGDEPNGTVTSVGVTNATNGGLTVSGSPVTSSGTITIGHSNVLSSAQTTQAVYPIKIDKNGHISAYGSAVTIPTVPSNIVNTITTTAGAHTTISSQKGNVSFNVPTKTSHLTNDSGFITSSALNNYLPLTGGQVTGPTTFGDTVLIDDLNAGQLVVSGSASIANNLQVNTINGVEVGSNPKFTDNNTTYSAGSNITLTGTTFSLTKANVTGALGYTPPTTNTTYSAGTGLSLSSTTFSVKLGYTTSGNNRAVQADSSGNLYVVQKDDNTTYSSKAAASGGTDVSLVTTGEKYTWNSKTSNTGTITSVKTTAGAHSTINVTSGAVSFNVPTTAAHVGIKFGYTTSGNNRAVLQDSSGNLYVTQKDDNTTYSIMSASELSTGTATTARTMSAANTKAGLLDLFYPVGSYYETSDSSFDPNTAWGGTWVLEASGQVHVSAGTGYTIGSTGGSTTHHHSTGNHTLTVNEMPSHTHAIAQRNGSGTQFSGWHYEFTINNSKGPIWNQNANVNRSTSAIGYTGGGQAHNHGNTGDGSNMQPYIVVNRWHRTA